MRDCVEETPETIYEKKEMTSAVRRVLFDNLDARMADVIKRRMGIDGPKESLEAIGANWNISRERVRQIEAKALRRVFRHPKVRLVLEQYIHPDKILDLNEKKRKRNKLYGD